MFVAGFIGQPKINFVTATCRDGKTDPFGISNPAANGSVTLGIRPESIQIDATGPYEAKVLSSEYLGDEYVAVIQYGENTLTVSQLTQEPSNSATVRFGLKQSELLWFDPATGKRLTPR
jgi:ABC-type sugar transport system ATPase subunit